MEVDANRVKNHSSNYRDSKTTEIDTKTEETRAKIVGMQLKTEDVDANTSEINSKTTGAQTTTMEIDAKTRKDSCPNYGGLCKNYGDASKNHRD